VSESTAARLLRRYGGRLARDAKADAAVALAVEVSRLDAARVVAWTIMQSTDNSATEKLKAVGVVTKIVALRSRLQNLEAPQKIAFTTPDGERPMPANLDDAARVRAIVRLLGKSGKAPNGHL
jgi:hypothetical protein